MFVSKQKVIILDLAQSHKYGGISENQIYYAVAMTLLSISLCWGICIHMAKLCQKYTSESLFSSTV